MNVALRVFLALLAAIIAYSLMSVALMLILPANSSVPVNILDLALRLTAAFWAGRLVWRRPESSSGSAMLGRSVAIGALLVGGIGFFAGFFGPMIFAPHSNQGPMLGIFITGPLGVILGGVGGAIRYYSRRRRGPAELK